MHDPVFSRGSIVVAAQVQRAMDRVKEQLVREGGTVLARSTASLGNTDHYFSADGLAFRIEFKRKRKHIGWPRDCHEAKV
jgi:hypothetical protein